MDNNTEDIKQQMWLDIRMAFRDYYDQIDAHKDTYITQSISHSDIDMVLLHENYIYIINIAKKDLESKILEIVWQADKELGSKGA